ncbi:MAG: hypothetical protein ACLQVF_13495 [Isosphaeraceae bacterium]
MTRSRAILFRVLATLLAIAHSPIPDKRRADVTLDSGRTSCPLQRGPTEVKLMLSAGD